MKVYDVIVIGAGPAGLSAGLYAGRAKLDTLIIEKQKYGGQITIMGGIDSASIDRPDWNKELVEQEVRRVCKENGTKYYIPCLTQGLGISTFPGVYEAASEVIDKISKEVF